MTARSLLLMTCLLASTGCLDGGIFDPGIGPRAPRELSYFLDPVGLGSDPAGILLRWELDPDPSIDVWHVYARSGNGNFGFIGATISNSFHESGIPALEYFVTAVDFSGNESARSNMVVVDSRLILARPHDLTTVSLDGAVALYWPDDAYLGDPGGFRNYRVYSSRYDLDQDRCAADWRLEGTTVAPEFRAGALANGLPRCFAASAVSVEGWESLWSPVRHDTPRVEARNIVKKNGGTNHSSISKNTDYVIVGEDAGSKAKKAAEINIKILTEDEFLAMV